MTNLWGEDEPHPMTPPRRMPAFPDGMSARDRARAREHRRWAEGNPLVALLGPGPVGVTCRTCAYLSVLPYHGRTYFKCLLRGKPTHGTATDHRCNWPTCARYVSKEHVK